MNAPRLLLSLLLASSIASARMIPNVKRAESIATVMARGGVYIGESDGPTSDMWILEEPRRQADEVAETRVTTCVAWVSIIADRSPNGEASSRSLMQFGGGPSWAYRTVTSNTTYLDGSTTTSDEVTAWRISAPGSMGRSAAQKCFEELEKQ